MASHAATVQSYGIGSSAPTWLSNCMGGFQHCLADALSYRQGRLIKVSPKLVAHLLCRQPSSGLQVPGNLGFCLKLLPKRTDRRRVASWRQRRRQTKALLGTVLKPCGVPLLLKAGIHRATPIDSTASHDLDTSELIRNDIVALQTLSMDETQPMIDQDAFVRDRVRKGPSSLLCWKQRASASSCPSEARPSAPKHSWSSAQSSQAAVAA